MKTKSWIFWRRQKSGIQFNPDNKCVFVFVIEGKLQIADVSLDKGDAVGIWETNNGAMKIIIVDKKYAYITKKILT